MDVQKAAAKAAAKAAKATEQYDKGLTKAGADHQVCLRHRISPYGGTPPRRKRTTLGPYRRPMPRVRGGSQEGGCVLVGEVPLQQTFLWTRHPWIKRSMIRVARKRALTTRFISQNIFID